MTQELTVKTKEQPQFIKKKHELDALLKELRKNNVKAVSLLADVLDDVKVDIKTRIDVAKSLIDFEVKIQDQINKEALNRQIAEVKANGAVKKLTLEEDDDRPAAPKLDFTTVREV